MSCCFFNTSTNVQQVLWIFAIQYFQLWVERKEVLITVDEKRVYCCSIFLTVGKSRYFWDSRWCPLPLFSCQSFKLPLKVEIFGAFWCLISLFSNSSYACSRQTNKFNHQTSFWNCKAAKFCVLKWVPESVQLTRIPAHTKSANAKNFTYKRVLRVTFSRLT